MARIHVVLNDELLVRLDEVLDGRPRSRFVERALEAALGGEESSVAAPLKGQTTIAVPGERRKVSQRALQQFGKGTR